MSKMKFPVLEVFTSIQGEGVYTGVPSVFVRVAGCNLRCVFGNSRCDTPYSSFELEKPIASTVDEAISLVAAELEKYPNVRHLVITGGEPMLYKEAIKKFYEELTLDWGLELTIETNGSLPALEMWDGEDTGYDTMFWVDLWSVSPKLSTSVDKQCKYLTEKQAKDHDEKRINIKNLASYMRDHINVHREDITGAKIQFKFVYSGEESVKEIQDIVEKVAEELDVSVNYVNEHVLLMPEGTTNDQLNNIAQECAEVCIREGWQFCDRLHIRIWGDKRGV